MFERLDYLSKHSIPKALDILFEEIDEACMAGQYEAVDIYMRHANVRRYRTEILVGFLTITFGWKDKLQERSGFYDRVKSLLEERIPDRVERVLVGLE